MSELPKCRLCGCDPDYCAEGVVCSNACCPIADLTFALDVWVKLMADSRYGESVELTLFSDNVLPIFGPGRIPEDWIGMRVKVTVMEDGK